MLDEAQVIESIALARNLLDAHPEHALEATKRALEISRSMSWKLGSAEALYLQGKANYRLGNLTEAAELLGQAAVLFDELDRPEQVETLIDLGRIQREQGLYGQAETQLARALELSRKLRDDRSEVESFEHLAALHVLQNDPAQAIDHLQRALSVAERRDDADKQVRILFDIANLHFELGEHNQAIAALQQAFRQSRDVAENQALQIECLHRLSINYDQLDASQLAMEHAEQALGLAYGDEREPKLLLQLANLNLKANSFAAAKEGFQRAIENVRELNRSDIATKYFETEIDALNGLGLSLAGLGETQVSLDAFRRALAVARESQHPQGIVQSLLHLGRGLISVGDTRQAAEQLENALVGANEIPNTATRQKSIANIHHALAEALETEQPKKALAHHRTFHQLQTETQQLQNTRRVQALESRLVLSTQRNREELHRLNEQNAARATAQAETEVAERLKTLEQSQLESISRLALAAESRDDASGAHTMRVGRNAALIAQALGWEHQQIELIRVAARLHDVGKIGIPDHILLKPDRLTPEEFKIVQEHTVIGARLLAGSRTPVLQLAEEIAATHHERWDGTGYPQNLSGENIPLSGRIVAVADVFDALTQNRPFRSGWTIESALTEIQTQSGKQFDPSVVSVSLEVLRRAGQDEKLSLQTATA